MEPGGSMPHSHGLSNNPYPEPNQPNSSYFLTNKNKTANEFNNKFTYIGHKLDNSVQNFSYTVNYNNPNFVHLNQSYFQSLKLD